MAYTPIIIAVDPAQITQDKIDALQALIPGLEVREGHPIYHILEVTSDRDAENLQLLSDTFDAIFDAFGGTILRLPQEAAIQATGLTTWTRVSSVGDLTIEAGTPITLQGADGNRVDFTTREDVTIPNGSLTTTTGGVEILATEPGEGGNGLQADPLPEQTFTWLDAIVVEAPTAGGVDAEDIDDYRDRIADEASLATKTLVQADNFAVAARNVAGVARALAIDNYDPGPPIDSSAAGDITVAVENAGADPGSTVRGNVLTELQSRALSGLNIHVIAPTFTAITVVFAGVADAGLDPADVEVRAEAAVLGFLNPATWGLPTLGDERLWIDTPLVRFQDVVTVLNNVDGFNHYTSLTINGGTADVTMTGPAALPDPASTAAGTVSAP